MEENKNTNMLSNEEMIKRLEAAKKNIEEYVSKGYDEPLPKITNNNNTQSKSKSLMLKRWGFINTVLLGIVFVVSMLITTIIVVFRVIY